MKTGPRNAMENYGWIREFGKSLFAYTWVESQIAVLQS
jgi:hypothetical protein